jgi:hypothetical protein
VISDIKKNPNVETRMHNSEVESTKENPVLLGVVLRGYVVFEE